MADLYKLEPGAPFAGDYTVVRPISVGGMGAVYEVEQTSTGKHRALKVMLPQLVADPSLRKRFEQEARIASMIDSEHVVEVVGAGIDAAQGVPWLAMELLVGEDLAKTVARRGALPIPEVLALFEQLCHAVGAAHRASIVHSDIKPENIFLAQSRRAGSSFTVKVLDFGIAKIVAEAKTRQTAAMGSPIWMAPEQAERSPVTPATDVWALGLVAFYLLTGRFFWKAANSDDATIPQLMREVLFEPIVPASMRTSELGTPLPPSFDGWFARCVAREPTARFVDAAQAFAALGPALGQGAQGEAYLPTAMQTPLHAQTVGAPGGAPVSYTSPSPGAPHGVATSPHVGQAPAAAYGPPPGVPMHASAPYAPPAAAPPMAPPHPGAATGAAAAYTIPGQGSPAMPAPQGPAPSRSKMPLVALAAAAVGVLVTIGVFAFVLRKPASPSTVAAIPTPTADLAAPAAPVASDSPLVAIGAGAGAPVAMGGLTTIGSAPTAVAAAPAPVAVASSPSKSDGSDVAAARPHAAAAAKPPPPGAAGASAPGAAVAQAAAAPPAPPPPPPPPPPAAPQRSIVDLARSTTSADWNIARAALEPKVINGAASIDEIRLLDEICKNEKDRACQKMCKRQLHSLGAR